MNTKTTDSTPQNKLITQNKLDFPNGPFILDVSYIIHTEAQYVVVTSNVGYVRRKT